MKTITMYELLGLVKDGKAPKKIKYKDKIYYYHEGYDFNYMYNSSTYSPMDKDKSLFTFDSYKMKDGRRCWDDNTMIDFLNDKVEIIEDTPEEEKKIPEKIEYYDDSIAWVIDGVGQLSDVDKVIIDKLNNVIDFLKSKGE